MHRLGRGAFGAEDVAQHGTLEQFGPQLFELPAAATVGAQHAVADVRAAVGQREHPRVAGEEVAFEEHPQPVVVHVGEVLAHRVPFAEVARRVGLERARRTCDQ